jgi:hypothetical protein
VKLLRAVIGGKKAAYDWLIFGALLSDWLIFGALSSDWLIFGALLSDWLADLTV